MDAKNLKLLTIQQVVELTGIQERKVRRLVSSGFFRRAPVAGRVVYVYEQSIYDSLLPVDTSTTTTH